MKGESKGQFKTIQLMHITSFNPVFGDIGIWKGFKLFLKFNGPVTRNDNLERVARSRTISDKVVLTRGKD